MAKKQQKKTDEVKPSIDETRAKMREIYSFVVEKTETVKQTERKEVKNPETGKMEEVAITKEIEESIPYRVIIKQPTRRQTEEAELEYSISMSQSIRKGILTKAMLAKKYSDTGGLLTETDARQLSSSYVTYGEISNDIQRLQTKIKKDENDKKKIENLIVELTDLRRAIVDLETTYSSLFNYTADSRAQNKVIQWYILHLSHVQKSDEDKIEALFPGETFEEKEENYYVIEEEGDELYGAIGGKLATLVSFWYYSSGAVDKDQFEKLDQDIEAGAL